MPGPFWNGVMKMSNGEEVTTGRKAFFLSAKKFVLVVERNVNQHCNSAW